MTEKMVVGRIRKAAAELARHRLAADGLEGALQVWIHELATESGHGSMEKLRAQLGISRAHMSDIRHGRKGIGTEVAVRLSEIRRMRKKTTSLRN